MNLSHTLYLQDSDDMQSKHFGNSLKSRIASRLAREKSKLLDGGIRREHGDRGEVENRDGWVKELGCLKAKAQQSVGGPLV